jgi:hypothetical protein
LLVYGMESICILSMRCNSAGFMLCSGKRLIVVA